MADVNAEFVAEIVDTVLARLKSQGLVSGSARQEGTDGVFDDVEAAIAATTRAQKIWAETSKEVKRRVIAALRAAMHEHAGDFSRRALEETGMGRFEDKVVKHHNSADATPVWKTSCRVHGAETKVLSSKTMRPMASLQQLLHRPILSRYSSTAW